MCGRSESALVNLTMSLDNHVYLQGISYLVLHYSLLYKSQSLRYILAAVSPNYCVKYMLYPRVLIQCLIQSWNLLHKRCLMNYSLTLLKLSIAC